MARRSRRSPRRDLPPLDRGLESRRPAPDEPADRTLEGARVAAWALLPLRFFLGGTFLYAGIDKLLDPAFLQATGPGSIGEQLQAFERTSPIAPLVHLFGDPFPVLIGLLIALLEITVGLGALLGLLFRLAAGAGAALAFLFFLTASWATHPYYYGPDLPYAAGWLTLALAGHGHLFTLEDWLVRRAEAARAWGARGPVPGYSRRTLDQRQSAFADTDRREFLQLGILAVASAVVATIAGTWPLRGSAPLADASPAPGAGSSPGAGGSPSAAAVASPTAAASAPAGETLIGDLATLKAQTAITFNVPTTGDPGILVELSGGKVACYDAVCTHQGCTVVYDSSAAVLFCPCHGAAFDPAHDAAVIQGPARSPLPKLPIQIDQATGKIYLTA